MLSSSSKFIDPQFLGLPVPLSELVDHFPAPEGSINLYYGLIGNGKTYAAPADTAQQWPQRVEGVRFVRCPAELADKFTCDQCGGGRPLCARGERDYVVVFVAHGTGAKKVGTGTGGCYAANGPTAIQWHGTKKTGAANDAQALRAFAASLPVGSKLRHHVAGDIGACN